MMRIMVSSVGGLALALLEVSLLWRDTVGLLKRKKWSFRGMFLRLLVSGVVMVVFLRFFQADVFFFVFSFSVVYFTLVFWLSGNRRDEHGRDL